MSASETDVDNEPVWIAVDMSGCVVFGPGARAEIETAVDAEQRGFRARKRLVGETYYLPRSILRNDLPRRRAWRHSTTWENCGGGAS